MKHPPKLTPRQAAILRELLKRSEADRDSNGWVGSGFKVAGKLVSDNELTQIANKAAKAGETRIERRVVDSPWEHRGLFGKGQYRSGTSSSVELRVVR